ncbi:Rrf2 family transcriptional regulator [Inhella gelatinilytica]|uniref:Rrf2 family transcriptional regulator n=1 Tax=Inhella gelatinilytica TaxID=2795030 RepID=A0A931IVX1_9BURK|nr:Rrf2 family transcriptional regulator [Inhella gelatinilytica]MBH9553810.1 Rrf2 family transcriptional regulator [Inhella gelatinilytica]
MRLTTKGRFAVTAMVDLALREHSGPVSLAAIAQRQQISLSYLEQLFGKLRRADLVESTRGPGGGYTLARSSNTITVADVIQAVDEALDATGCGGHENCMGHDTGACLTHDLWTRLNERMLDFLSGVSLGQIVEEQRAKGVAVEEIPVSSIKRAFQPSPLTKPIRVNAPNSVFDLGTVLSK